MPARDFIAAAELLEAQDHLWKDTGDRHVFPDDCTCTALALMRQEPDLGEIRLMLQILGIRVPDTDDEDLNVTDPDNTVWAALIKWNDDPATTLEDAIKTLRRTALVLS